MINYFTVTFFTLLAILSPGPDFFLVTKNALAYNRACGIATALGISVGAIFLAIVCILGLVYVVTHSTLAFEALKYIGGSYLIYLGTKSLFSKQSKNETGSEVSHLQPDWLIPKGVAFKQGFLCSALNPKAMLFFSSLFTLVISASASIYIKLAYALQVFMLYVIWFVALAMLITKPKVKNSLDRFQHIISRMLGLLLCLLGVKIFFLSP